MTAEQKYGSEICSASHVMKSSAELTGKMMTEVCEI